MATNAPPKDITAAVLDRLAQLGLVDASAVTSYREATGLQNESMARARIEELRSSVAWNSGVG